MYFLVKSNFVVKAKFPMQSFTLFENINFLGKNNFFCFKTCNGIIQYTRIMSHICNKTSHVIQCVTKIPKTYVCTVYDRYFFVLRCEDLKYSEPYTAWAWASSNYAQLLNV